MKVMGMKMTNYDTNIFSKCVNDLDRVNVIMKVCNCSKLEAIRILDLMKDEYEREGHKIMIYSEDRKRVGTLIRILLNIDIKKEAEMLGVKPNTIYQFELGKFSSAKIERWYDFYYQKLNLEDILVKVGCFKTFTRWEEYLDQKEDK